MSWAVSQGQTRLGCLGCCFISFFVRDGARTPGLHPASSHASSYCFLLLSQHPQSGQIFRRVSLRILRCGLLRRGCSWVACSKANVGVRDCDLRTISYGWGFRGWHWVARSLRGWKRCCYSWIITNMNIIHGLVILEQGEWRGGLAMHRWVLCGVCLIDAPLLAGKPKLGSSCRSSLSGLSSRSAELWSRLWPLRCWIPLCAVWCSGGRREGVGWATDKETLPWCGIWKGLRSTAGWTRADSLSSWSSSTVTTDHQGGPVLEHTVLP
jgi:hypothetical protein